MTKNDKSVTAEELLAQLRKDPKFVARGTAREQKLAKLEIALQKEEEPLVKDLRDAGYRVHSVWDLVNTKGKYPDAIPVLLNHLDKQYSLKVREGIIRALTVPEARGTATQRLVEEFQSEYASEAKSDYKWVVGSALEVVVTDDVMPDILEILSDASHGDARQMLALAVGKTKKFKKEAVATLVNLLSNNIFSVVALKSLRKLKAIEARSCISKLLEHEDKTVRKEAEKTLEALNKITKKDH